MGILVREMVLKSLEALLHRAMTISLISALLIVASGNVQAGDGPPSVISMVRTDIGYQFELTVHINHTSTGPDDYYDKVEWSFLGLSSGSHGGSYIGEWQLNSTISVGIGRYDATSEENNSIVQVRAHCSQHGWGSWTTFIVGSPDRYVEKESWFEASSTPYIIFAAETLAIVVLALVVASFLDSKKKVA